MFSPRFGSVPGSTAAPSQRGTGPSASDRTQTTTTPPSRPAGGPAAMQASGAPAPPPRQAIVPVPGATHGDAESALGAKLAMRLADLSEILRDAISSKPGGAFSFLTGRLEGFDFNAMRRDLRCLGFDVVFSSALENAQSWNDGAAAPLEDLINLRREVAELEAELAHVLGHDDRVAPPAKPAPLVKKTGAAGGLAQPVLPGLNSLRARRCELARSRCCRPPGENGFACGRN